MICIKINNSGFDAALEKARSEDMIELHLDTLDLSDGQIKKICAQKAKTIVKITPGKPEEKERVSKLKRAIMAGAEFVNIESDVRDEFYDELVPFARTNNCRVIISFLDKGMTPVKRELEQIVKDCSMKGADIVSISCKVNNSEDNVRLLSLYSLGKNLIVTGLGNYGRITRVAATYLGAEFTYARSDEENEKRTLNEGLMNRSTMIEICKLIEKK